MPQALYRVNSGPSPTTSPTALLSLSASTTKTILQLSHSSNALTVVEWGVSYNGSALATPIQCELIDTGTVAATVTAFVANDVTLFTDPTANTPGINLGTAASGYNASAEGSVVAPVRVGDYQQIEPIGQFLKQFPLGQEFNVPAGHMLRIRLTSANPITSGVLGYVTFAVS